MVTLHCSIEMTDQPGIFRPFLGLAQLLSHSCPMWVSFSSENSPLPSSQSLLPLPDNLHLQDFVHYVFLIFPPIYDANSTVPRRKKKKKKAFSPTQSLLESPQDTEISQSCETLPGLVNSICCTFLVFSGRGSLPSSLAVELLESKQGLMFPFRSHYLLTSTELKMHSKIIH